MKFIVCSFFLLFSFFTNTHAQVKRGGTLSYCHSDYIRNLYPHNITDAISYNVANHVYEGLFRFDASDLSTKKCLAESYSVDSTGTVYTITLKKNVFFHDDACFKGGKGREMTSEDIRYCFTKLCMQDISNQGFQTFQNILKGANEYYEASANGVTPGFRLEGIRIVDRYS
ncbi:MAG: ABC transporter substrate-binding protein, partial [Cytophagaceae bacterium]